MENEVIELLKDHNNLESFGYMILFLYSVGGGYIGIITAGVFSSLGKFDLSISILLAICGNVIGSSLFCVFARTQKSEVFKIFKKHKRKLAYLQIMIKKYDWIIFLISKFIHGFRTFVPIAVGISKYSLIKFLCINFIACIIWGISLGLLGFYATGMLLPILKFLLQYPYLFAIILLTLITIFTVISYIRKRLSKDNNIQLIDNRSKLE
ncbi:DedA family protein [Helicobacter muridarum]|uniref:DedA family protein n=1 Tax=Helicobacter muridarum TaxID=216 RepID=A0A377PWM5_9HELI|nr:DedA family protein [Helicobacter muridarum]TLE00879.1 DedA family protein [Helicobacter muridarum]STQ86651.1 integral membrane protein [Helicobacter muridarum]